jgi:hypothetical protein
MSNEINIFELAAVTKLRFQTTKGYVTTEDLYDLNLQTLNRIAKAVNKELKSAEEEDFIDEPSKTDKVNTLRLDLLKHVIKVKKDAQEAAVNASKKKAEIAKLKELIAEKKDAALKDQSLDELQEQLKQLQD